MLCLAEVLAEVFGGSVWRKRFTNFLRKCLTNFPRKCFAYTFAYPTLLYAIDCFWCLCCFAFVVGDLAEVPRKFRGSIFLKAKETNKQKCASMRANSNTADAEEDDSSSDSSSLFDGLLLK